MFTRCPHLRVLEKALRLAHRHAHQRSNPAHQRSNPAHQRSNPALCCFLLGSISVDDGGSIVKQKALMDLGLRLGSLQGEEIKQSMNGLVPNHNASRVGVSRVMTPLLCSR